LIAGFDERYAITRPLGDYSAMYQDQLQAIDIDLDIEIQVTATAGQEN